MVEPKESLENIEITRAEDRYFLTKTDAGGQKSQLALTEAEIVFLGQAIPQYTRKIAVERTVNLPGISLSFSFPVERVSLNTDLNTHHILLTIYDGFGGDAGYSLSPAQAHDLGHKIIALAAEAQKQLDHVTKQ